MPSKNYLCTAFTVGFLAFLLSVEAAFAAPARSSQATLLAVVNSVRTGHGLRPLRLDGTLERAANAWSERLMRTNSFTHGDFSQRMQSFGVDGYAGENLAWGSGPYASARSVVAQWMRSPHHRANLLNASYRRVGLGIARGTFLGYGGSAVVTADFEG
jgi:uncharacterized protein YkwD